MADAFAEIDQYVIVMMENRSFDHMLGYLALPPWNAGREPVRSFADSYACPPYAGAPIKPKQVTSEQGVGVDLPHGRREVWTQLARQADGRFAMDGFVKAAYGPGVAVPDEPRCMGYLTPACVPVTNYLAAEFRVCDHWFSPIPTSTHPNRMMSVAGWTPYEDPSGQLAALPNTVLDFLTKHGVPWRVFARRESLFCLVTHFTYEGLKGSARFPPWADFEFQWNAAPSGPCVWFIEPGYSDAPWGDFPREDDHPPLTCAAGQQFVREVYRIVRSNDARWRRTLMIYLYDEHGGFFDSEPPLPIPTRAPRVPHTSDAVFPDFPCTGPRVPAILVSPWVDPATTATADFDHTSILRTLVEKFAPDDRGYFVDHSNAECVFSRPVASLRPELTRTAPRDMPLVIPVAPGVPPEPPIPETGITQAFRLAQKTAGL